MENELRKMEKEEYKKVITEMLDYVHKVCVTNNIRYFLAFGSLLGAIRHNGIIPWDDDIDIWMLSEDYERFVDVFTKSTSEYYILCSDNSPNYYNLLTRICAKSGILKLNGIPDIDNLGPFIDIFPIYKAPPDYNERIAFFKEIVKANRNIRYCLPLHYYKTITTTKQKLICFCRVIIRLPLRFFVGLEKLKEKRKKLINKYMNTASDLWYSVTDVSTVSDKRVFTKDVLLSVEFHEFEGIEVCIPLEYHKILTRIYGNYMELPPAEKRITKHHFIPYWR